jgi:hypothetical protein
VGQERIVIAIMMPTDEFGKLEPSAHFLLEQASGLALRSAQELDALHIMLVALTEPAIAGSAAQSLAMFLNEEQHRMCIGATQGQLHLHGRPTTGPGTLSPNLRQCVDLWKEEAQRRSLRVTETLIFWAVITGDPVVPKILRAFAVDLDGLLRDLERRFEITSKLPPPLSGQGDEIRNHTEVISPSTGCQFVRAHAVLMSNVLNVLGTLDYSQIAVLSGQNGTALHHVEQVLADMLASGMTFSDERPRLQHDYQGVYRLNIAGVRALAQLPNKPKPFEVLQAMLRLAAQERAILVLNGIDLLRQHTDVDEQMLAVLANPDEALILGLYDQPQFGERSPTETLNLANIANITAHAYSPTQTKALLGEYYLPHWTEKYGMTFAADAFDHIIALEPGAWINLERKTLPYLAVGLASDVIQTVLGGEALIRETAIMAIDALDKLQEEWATTEPRIRDKFEHVLDEARQEITSLQEAPLPEVNAKGQLVLTRAYPTAQLICPNDSEFHYPGHAPETLTGQRLDDFPIHLHDADTRTATG